MQSFWISGWLLCPFFIYWCCDRNGVWKNCGSFNFHIQSNVSSFDLGSCFPSSLCIGWHGCYSIWGCQVPLTAVLLLFELTQDYRIVLPLLGAIRFSTWITAGKVRKRTTDDTKQLNNGNAVTISSENSTTLGVKEPNGTSICALDSSLCLNSESDNDVAENLANDILVSLAMITGYVKTLLNTSLTDVVSLMLEEKQSYALVVDDNHLLIGLLTLNDIQQFIELSMPRKRKPEMARVFELCSSYSGRCIVSCTANPNMSLLTALSLMNRHGMSQLPVVMFEEGDEDRRGRPVSLLDRKSINLAFRALAIRDGLNRWFIMVENSRTEKRGKYASLELSYYIIHRRHGQSTSHFHVQV